jgi:hypothetical protein
LVAVFAGAEVTQIGNGTGGKISQVLPYTSSTMNETEFILNIVGE